MDVNGTRFHMLTGEHDWEPLLAKQGVVDAWWDRERLGLGLLPQVLQFPQTSAEDLLTASDRRGAAEDRYGNIYWVGDDERSVNILPAGTDKTGLFWSLEDFSRSCKTTDAASGGDFAPLSPTTFLADQPSALRGLAVTRHHYLVVGTLETGGLLVFDLHAGGPPAWLKWPAESDFAPFDLAPAVDCGVWILDWGPGEGLERYWRLNHHFGVVPVAEGAPAQPDTIADFVPLNGDSPVTNTFYSFTEVQENLAATLAVYRPVSIQGLEDDSLLVLAESGDASYSIVHRFVGGSLQNSFELSGGILAQVFADPTIKAHDFAFTSEPPELPGQVKGELSVVIDNGNQAIAFGLLADDDELSLTVRPRYMPLRRFSGKALVPASSGVYYDIGDRWYLLTAQPRRRYSSEAEIDGLIFDGKEPLCRWHRIVIDGCIPDGAVIEIQSRAADDLELLQYSDWQSEAAPYLRNDGSEISWHEPFKPDETGHKGTGTWEWVFRHARGRYVELRLNLSGNGRVTPRIRALRVYYPRFSYLNKFLPAVYREDDHHARFLDRYLANVEGFFTSLEGRIAQVEVLFDTRTAPAEYLPWLAGWLGAIADQNWSTERLQLFIDHAGLMFRWRGTQIGMRAAIRLMIDECPDVTIFSELQDGRNEYPGGAGGRTVRIVERFLQRRSPGVTTESRSGGQGLAVSTVSTAFNELGNKDRLDQRYREFLYWRYAQLGESGDFALDMLNAAWDKSPAYESFYEIEFSSDRPEQATELSDWFLFLRRELAQTQTWEPAHGTFALHVRFQEWVRRKYSREAGEAEALAALNDAWQQSYLSFEHIAFSPVRPQSTLKADDWIEFIDTDLGFTYGIIMENDTGIYRDFLARRYKQIEKMNQAYGLSNEQGWDSFDEIELPAEDDMPVAARALNDWIQFASLSVPIRRNAHRFTVLVPTEPGELPQTRERRKEQVAQIVKNEKPAHTDFDVKLYWALFQVGSARLGLDTIVGDSARYVAIVLGGTYLGQGILGSSHAWDITDRRLIGRDRLQQSLHGEP